MPGRAPVQPYFQQVPIQRGVQPQAQRIVPGAVQRSRNDIYLPPMPEMVHRQPAAAGVSARPSSPARSSRPESPAGAELVRAQGPDEARPGSGGRVQLPSPEQLGLLPSNDPKRESQKAARSETGSSSHLDWSAARRRLDGVGAQSFRLEKSAEGGFRFSCVLAYANQPARERHFEAHAGAEAEAVELALRQAEQWRLQGKTE